MLKTIVVAAAGTSQTKAALDTAAILALPYNAHIECLRIHPDPTQALAAAASADMGSGMVVASMLESIREDDQRRTKASRKTFDEVCKQRNIDLADRPSAYGGVTASWREDTGEETDCVVARAHFNDLVVLEHQASVGGLSAISAGTVLLGSGRPILIAAAESPSAFPRAIAISWKETPEAARALSAALPLLVKAERLIVVSVNEEPSKEAAVRLSLGNAVDYLRWHGLTVEGRYAAAAPTGAAETMLSEVKASGAELLVMGGYGHSRLREFILGGFTRRVLSGVNLPVFLFH